MGGLLSRGPSIGELPEHVQGALDVSGQGDGIEGMKLRGEGLSLGRGEFTGGEDPSLPIWVRQ
jgi:hypothetical protein